MCVDGWEMCKGWRECGGIRGQIHSDSVGRNVSLELRPLQLNTLLGVIHISKQPTHHVGISVQARVCRRLTWHTVSAVVVHVTLIPRKHLEAAAHMKHGWLPDFDHVVPTAHEAALLIVTLEDRTNVLPVTTLSSAAACVAMAAPTVLVLSVADIF